MGKELDLIYNAPRGKLSLMEKVSRELLFLSIRRNFNG